MKNLIIIFVTLFGLNSYAAFSPQGETTIDRGEINIEGGQLPTISLTFKNTGSAVDTLSLSAVNPNYKISINRCNNVAPNKTCQVSLSPQRAPSLGIISFDFNGFSISMEVVRKDSQGNPIVPVTAAIMEFVPSTIPDIVFSSTEKSKTISFSVRNTGKSSAVPSVSWVSNLNNAKITVNRCSSSLPPGKTCSMTIVFSKPTSEISQSLSLTYTGDGSPKSLSFSLKLDTASNANCNFNGSPVIHGQSIQAYSSSSVPYGQSCSSEQRTCSNGVLSGNNSFSSCAAEQAASCLANSITYQHGESVPGFSQASVAFGESCVAFATSGTCSNGTIENSPTSFTCEESMGISCQLGSQTINPGGTMNGYSMSSVPYGSTCDSITVSCDGNSGIITPITASESCVVDSPLNCDFNGQTISHGNSIEAFSQETVVFGETCISEQRSCNNGILSGLNSYSSCSVLPEEFIPGFQLMSNINTEGNFINSFECAFENPMGPNPPFIAIREEMGFGSPGENTQSLDQSFCQSAPSFLFNNMNAFPSSTNQENVVCSNGQISIEASMELFMAAGNNCGFIGNYAASHRIYTEISIGTAPVLGFSNITNISGIGDNILFSADLNLYKVPFSSGLLANPEAPTPIKINGNEKINSDRMAVVGQRLIYQAEDGTNEIYSYDPSSLNNPTKISFPCGGFTCFYITGFFNNKNGTVYISALNSNNYSYVYKTTDGINFIEVINYSSNSGIYPFSSGIVTEHSGYIYYRQEFQEKLMRFKVDGTGVLEDTGIRARHIIPINSKLYIVTYLTPTSNIVEIDSNNNLNTIHNSNNNITRVSIGTNLFYYTEDTGSTYNLHKFNTLSNTPSLVKAAYATHFQCSSIGDYEFVNKLNDSFIFDCYYYPTASPKSIAISKDGVEKTFTDYSIVTTENSPFNLDTYFRTRPKTQVYRDKVIFFGIKRGTTDIVLLSLDSSDNIGEIRLASGNTNTPEVYYGGPILLYRDNLFFGGNNLASATLIPFFSFELYKYYEEPAAPMK